MRRPGQLLQHLLRQLSCRARRAPDGTESSHRAFRSMTSSCQKPLRDCALDSPSAQRFAERRCPPAEPTSPLAFDATPSRPPRPPPRCDAAVRRARRLRRRRHERQRRAAARPAEPDARRPRADTRRRAHLLPDENALSAAAGCFALRSTARGLRARLYRNARAPRLARAVRLQVRRRDLRHAAKGGRRRRAHAARPATEGRHVRDDEGERAARLRRRGHLDARLRQSHAGGHSRTSAARRAAAAAAAGTVRHGRGHDGRRGAQDRRRAFRAGSRGRQLSLLLGRARRRARSPAIRKARPSRRRWAPTASCCTSMR